MVTQQEEKYQAGTVMDFWAYDRPLEIVLPFKYLIILLTETGDDWTALIANIWKAGKGWSCLDLIVGREGADTQTLGVFTSQFSRPS